MARMQLSGTYGQLSVGLRNVRVTVPTAVRRGDPVHLYCQYELEDNERLYSIKWYKGKREFYRYTPQVHPSVQVFSTVSGIDVEFFFVMIYKMY
uniref:Ig-like domain-containing protein n=1 Tax=Anopheles epiroticus TaxID=199890 RepID=A0A182PG56_9DIPT